MLWSVMRFISKTSSVTPDFFYVFNIILSFSTCSQSFKKICTWEILGANVLKKIGGNQELCQIGKIWFDWSVKNAMEVLKEI